MRNYLVLFFLTAPLLIACSLGFGKIQETDNQSNDMNQVMSGSASTTRNQNPSSQVDINSDDQGKTKHINVNTNPSSTSEKGLPPESQNGSQVKPSVPNY